MVLVSDDVGGVAAALRALDPHLHLRYSEAGEYWVVYWSADPSQTDEDVEREERGETYLVTSAQDLDHRLVKRIEKVYWECKQPGYSLAAELDKIDAKAEQDAKHEWGEKYGEIHERMAHALRKDTHRDKRKIFVPEAV